MARADRHLKANHTGVTPEHLEAVRKMAQARYFKEEASPTTAPVTPVAPWTARVLDLNGAVADLSSLDKTTQGKIEEIVLTGGRNDHADTVLSGSNPPCKHWAVGKGDRIVGNVVGAPRGRRNGVKPSPCRRATIAGPSADALERPG